MILLALLPTYEPVPQTTSALDPGQPHRGRITEAEKELVRGNLEQINTRLRQAGLREIDPNDPTMRERYGL